MSQCAHALQIENLAEANFVEIFGRAKQILSVQCVWTFNRATRFCSMFVSSQTKNRQVYIFMFLPCQCIRKLQMWKKKVRKIRKFNQHYTWNFIHSRTFQLSRFDRAWACMFSLWSGKRTSGYLKKKKRKRPGFSPKTAPSSTWLAEAEWFLPVLPRLAYLIDHCIIFSCSKFNKNSLTERPLHIVFDNTLNSETLNMYTFLVIWSIFLARAAISVSLWCFELLSLLLMFVKRVHFLGRGINNTTAISPPVQVDS